MSNNHISLLGCVARDPQFTTFEDTSNKVVKFSIWIREYSANKETKNVFFDVEAWNGLGDRVLQYVTKGREIKIDGRMILSTYQKKINGHTVDWPKAFVKLQDFHLCGPKPATEEAETEPEPSESEAAAIFA
jgi:single-strand DNA-binding protein